MRGHTTHDAVTRFLPQATLCAFTPAARLEIHESETPLSLGAADALLSRRAGVELLDVAVLCVRTQKRRLLFCGSENVNDASSESSRDGDGNDGDPVDGSAEPVPFGLHAIFRSVALRSLGYSHLHSSGNC